MPLALLDTDTLSEIIKGRNPAVAARATQYLARYGSFTFSLMARFEILRGLKAKNATTQLAAFEARCLASTVLPHYQRIAGLALDRWTQP